PGFRGAEETDPSPVDRRKPGTKHTLLVDPHGVPLAIHTAGANASDHKQIIPFVLDFRKVGASPGGPRSCPTTCTPTGATIAKPPAGCCAGRARSRTSASERASMAAAWARCAG